MPETSKKRIFYKNIFLPGTVSRGRYKGKQTSNFQVMKTLSFYPYTKKFLAQVLGVSNATLTRYLNTHKTELLNKFPEYSATDKRLHPELFKFVCSNHGVHNDFNDFNYNKSKP